MSLTLGEKQEVFMAFLGSLLQKAGDLGYDVRGKELYRTEQQARWNASHCATLLPNGHRCSKHVSKHGPNKAIKHKFRKIGIVNSLHRVCLAIDLVLAIDSKVTWKFEDYRALGEYWESLNHLCCWGGRFNDAGHFSVTHQGRK